MRITGQLLRSRTKKPLHIAQYIDLSSTNIVTLDHLEICPKLRTLVARNNRLESVPNLDCCSQLWKVDIAHNKLKCLNGFSRFSVLGCLVLSNNCLDWGDVEKLCHVHILELSLHGNPKLEKDPYYRTHVIDSLPLLWMLDGRLVTFAERFQVSKFFKESELTERPVRHKIPKKRFTPTSLKNLPVTGVFGEKTEHWMKRFPLNEKMSKELDQRRLHYLAYNLKEDVRLQATYVDAMRSSVSEDLFLEIVVQREKDKEKSNMLLLLLVAFLEFRIPNDVIEQALDIAKLNKIGSYETRHIFLLSRVNQCRVASLLLAGIKIDRDAKLEDGLYDTLYLCLCNLVAERHKLSNGDCVTRKPGSRDILAAEVVQLFCIVPAFLMLVSRDPGLIDLVSSATRDPDITEQLCDILWKGKVKKGNPEDIFQVLGSYILKKIHKRYPQPGKSGKNTPISPERKDLPLRLSNYTKTLEGKGVLPKRAQSAVYVTHHSCDAGFTSNDTGNKSSKTSSSSGRKSAQSRQSTTKRVELGDKVYTEDQVYGHIVALPDKNIALVRQHVIPARGYLQNRIHASLNNRFVYVDTQMLQWQHHQGFWNLKEKEKDNDMKLPHKRHEENSENFMTETIKKELPIEVWMSFTTEDSSAKPSLDSESCGTVITKHVRELVRECIKEAKTRNHERNDESAVDSKPIEQHNVQFDERESTKNAEDFEEIHDKEEESFHETENDIEWERDDDMISQTENYRLEAWKFFHLANLEERAIAEQKVSSVQQSRPSRVGSCCITSRHGRHGSVSASKDVYTSSGKRLSFPLPGWIEELHAISQQRSYSKSADLPRKSYDSEIKESWAPIISPAPVARSGCRSTHVKSGNNTYGNNIEYCPKHRPKCQQRPS